MLVETEIKSELHTYGGNGRFILAKSDEIIDMLVKEYKDSVQLIYLDPPFGTGDKFTMLKKVNGTRITVSTYDDTLNDEQYIEMMRNIMNGCKKMLTKSGAIYVHVDYRMSVKMRLLLDEVFGENNFVNEIIWSYKSGGRATNHFSRKHDTILLYKNGKSMLFNLEAIGTLRGTEQRSHMKKSVDEEGKVYFSIRSGGKIYKYYEDSMVYPSDVWDDIEHLHQKDPERTGYSTQKPEELLRRIILASSNENDIVASKNNRHWVSVDCSPVAMNVLRMRQLKTCEEISLFSKSEPMLIEHLDRNAIDHNIEVELKVEKTSSEKYKITVISQSGDCPISYFAVGYVSNNINSFTPEVFTTNINEGTALYFINKSDKPFVIHIADYRGRQKFFKYVQ